MSYYFPDLSRCLVNRDPRLVEMMTRNRCGTNVHCNNIHRRTMFLCFATIRHLTTLFLQRPTQRIGSLNKLKIPRSIRNTPPGCHHDRSIRSLLNDYQNIRGDPWDRDRNSDRTDYTFFSSSLHAK